MIFCICWKNYIVPFVPIKLCIRTGGRVDTLNRAFGCRVCTPEDKPTNGEFIAMLADKLSLERSA